MMDKEFMQKMRKQRKHWPKTYKCFFDNHLYVVTYMRECGISKPKIAKHFNRSVSGFYYWCDSRNIK